MRTQNERMPRVLLVEDAPFLRYAFGRLLRLQGFDVREANDGQDALACLADFQPQLVLTDLMMPVMSGLELISGSTPAPRRRISRWSRSRPTRPTTPRSRPGCAGAADFITKPVDLPELLERLRNLMPAAPPSPEPAVPARSQPPPIGRPSGRISAGPGHHGPIRSESGDGSGVPRPATRALGEGH